MQTENAPKPEGGEHEAVAAHALLLTYQLVLTGSSTAMLTVPAIVGSLLYFGRSPLLLVCLWVGASVAASGVALVICLRSVRSAPWANVSIMAYRLRAVVFSVSMVHGFALLLVPHHRYGQISPMLFALLMVFAGMVGANVLLGFGDKRVFTSLVVPLLGYSIASAVQLGGFVGLVIAVGTAAYVAIMFAMNRLAGNAFAESFLLRMRNEALVTKLETQVRVDPLTGIANRAGLWHEMERRGGNPSDQTSVLYLDLNGFKPINDAYGHSVGDDVLKTVAARLSAHSRVGDVVARMGGDEFAVVAASASAEEAQALMDRLGEALNEPMVIEGCVVRISASIGLARSVEGDSLEQTLMRADQRMYEMKRERRLHA